jgi:hypothetical protein
VNWKTLGGKHKYKPLNNNPPPNHYNPSYSMIEGSKGNALTTKSKREVKEEVKPDAG